MNCHLIWLIFPGIAMIPWQTLHTDWEHWTQRFTGASPRTTAQEKVPHFNNGSQTTGSIMVSLMEREVEGGGCYPPSEVAHENIFETKHPLQEMSALNLCYPLPAWSMLSTVLTRTLPIWPYPLLASSPAPSSTGCTFQKVFQQGFNQMGVNEIFSVTTAQHESKYKSRHIRMSTICRAPCTFRQVQTRSFGREKCYIMACPAWNHPMWCIDHVAKEFSWSLELEPCSSIQAKVSDFPFIDFCSSMVWWWPLLAHLKMAWHTRLIDRKVPLSFPPWRACVACHNIMCRRYTGT